MSATGSNSPKTFAQFKARKKRRELTFPLVNDADAVTSYRLIEERLKKARLRGTPAEQVKQLETELAAAEQQIRESTILMRLRALPRGGEDTYSALKAKHPPTQEDHDRAQEETGDDTAKARWHFDTFAPALVAACLVEPKVTVDEAREMADDMTDVEWSALFLAAVTVNETLVDTAGLVFS